MKYLAVILALITISACTFTPVLPQAEFEAYATARAQPVPPVTIEPQVVPPTATVELVPTVTPTATCTILGNINAQGIKTAFKPGDAPYSQVKLDKPGERCFATMDEAVAAGFTPYRGN